MGDPTKLGQRPLNEHNTVPELDEEELKKKAAMNNSAINERQESDNPNPQSKESSSWVSSAKSMVLTGSRVVGIGTIGVLLFSAPIWVPAALVLVGLAIQGATGNKGKGLPSFEDKKKIPSQVRRRPFDQGANYDPEKDKEGQQDDRSVVSSQDLANLQKQMQDLGDDGISIASTKIGGGDDFSVQSQGPKSDLPDLPEKIDRRGSVDSNPNLPSDRTSDWLKQDKENAQRQLSSEASKMLNRRSSIDSKLSDTESPSPDAKRPRGQSLVGSNSRGGSNNGVVML